MGRGGGRQAQREQSGKVGTAADTAGSEATDAFGTVSGADKAIIANPMTEQEKQSTLQPLAESFDASSQAAGNLVSKTRNASGYQASLDKQAQTRGSETAQANADLANTADARKSAALNREAGMFGTASGAQTGRLGIQSGVVNDYAKSYDPGFLDQYLLNAQKAAASAATFGGG